MRGIHDHKEMELFQQKKVSVKDRYQRKPLPLVHQTHITAHQNSVEYNQDTYVLVTNNEYVLA